MFRLAARCVLRSSPLISHHCRPTSFRSFTTSLTRPNANVPTKIHNMLGGGPAPPVQVRRVSEVGIELEDGVILPSACIFLDGNVFLWNVPVSGSGNGSAWTKEMFEVFEVVVPKPEILILGTGKRVSHPSPSVKAYLNSIGIQLDVMDTWNACSTYNLLAEEGRHVAAALLPTAPRTWKKQT